MSGQILMILKVNWISDELKNFDPINPLFCGVEMFFQIMLQLCYFLKQRITIKKKMFLNLILYYYDDRFGKEWKQLINFLW